jgi:hypothetical protein
MTKIKHGKDERLVDLEYWMGDGQIAGCENASLKLKKNRPTVSVGRTDSKYGLGFWIDEDHNFVLNREQVIALRNYLTYSIARLKGDKGHGLDMTSIFKAIQEDAKRHETQGGRSKPCANPARKNWPTR